MCEIEIFDESGQDELTHSLCALDSFSKWNGQINQWIEVSKLTSLSTDLFFLCFCFLLKCSLVCIHTWFRICMLHLWSLNVVFTLIFWQAYGWKKETNNMAHRIHWKIISYAPYKRSKLANWFSLQVESRWIEWTKANTELPMQIKMQTERYKECTPFECIVWIYWIDSCACCCLDRRRNLQKPIYQITLFAECNALCAYWKCTKCTL